MRKIISLMMQPAGETRPAWHTAPTKRQPLALLLHRMRRRHIAAHAALLDVLIPDTLRA